MTVSTTISRVGYAGDGITYAFTIPFPFFDAGDLQVIERVAATGVEKYLSLGVHYAVSGGQGGTGTVTLNVAPLTGREIHIRRRTALTQLVDYTPHDPFPAETHEEALDRAVLRDQDIIEMLLQTVKFPQTDATTVDATLPSAPVRANKALVFDRDGNVSVSVDNYIDQAVNATAQAQAAQASASAAASSASSANSSALAAAGSASSASGSATAAASSASAASTSRSQAATSASGAASSASSAAVHATNSAASATAAATSASNAATSAGEAQAYAQQVATAGLPSPVGKALNFLRQNITETAVEYRTPSQVVTDILPSMAGHAGEALVVNAIENTLVYVPQPTGFANELINGDFRIWQLGTDLRSSWTGAPYIADGWQWIQFNPYDLGATFTRFQVDTDRYALRIFRQLYAGTWSVRFRQMLSSYAMQRLRGRTITLSYSAMGLSGPASVTVRFESYKNEGGSGGTTIHATQTITPTASWERNSLTFTLPASLTDLGGAIVVTTATGPQLAEYYFTDFDLRVSPMAMPFERRPVAIELALCQERIWKSYPLSVAPNTPNATAGRLGWNTFAGNVINHSGLIQRVPTMRAVPSVVWISDVTGAYQYLRDNSTGTNIQVTQTLETSDSSSGYPQTAPVFQAGAWITGHLVLLANI